MFKYLAFVEFIVTTFSILFSIFFYKTYHINTQIKSYGNLSYVTHLNKNFRYKINIVIAERKFSAEDKTDKII